MREQAATELAPYRGRMKALQIRQIEQQFLRKAAAGAMEVCHDSASFT